MSRISTHQRKLQILQLLAPILSKEGKEARSSSLAKSAGISEALLFKYFKNKEALLRELEQILIHKVEGALQHISFDASATTSPSPKDLLETIARHIIQDTSDPMHKAARLFLARSVIDGNGFATHFLEKTYGKFAAFFEKWISALKISEGVTLHSIQNLTPSLGERLWIFHHSCFGLALFDGIGKVKNEKIITFLVDSFFEDLNRDLPG
jgi:AcrR family transcriptional regulator